MVYADSLRGHRFAAVDGTWDCGVSACEADALRGACLLGGGSVEMVNHQGREFREVVLEVVALDGVGDTFVVAGCRCRVCRRSWRCAVAEG